MVAVAAAQVKMSLGPQMECGMVWVECAPQWPVADRAAQNMLRPRRTSRLRPTSGAFWLCTALVGVGTQIGVTALLRR